MCLEKFEGVLNAVGHLRSAHGMKDGQKMRCMKIQKGDSVCVVECTSFKALRKHLRESSCQIFCIDINEGMDDVTSQTERENTFDENVFSSAFEDLHFEDQSHSEKEIESDNSLRDLVENFARKLIISHLPHNIVNDVFEFSKELVCKTIGMNVQLLKDTTSTVDIEKVLDSTKKQLQRI